MRTLGCGLTYQSNGVSCALGEEMDRPLVEVWEEHAAEKMDRVEKVVEQDQNPRAAGLAKHRLRLGLPVRGAEDERIVGLSR